MTQETQINIRCDFCKQLLKDFELDRKKEFFGIVGNMKPASKYKIQTNFNGDNRKGDLCYNCSELIKQLIDNIKRANNAV